MSSLKNFKFQKEDDDQLLEDEEQNVPKLVRERNRDEHMRTILKSIEAGHLFNQSEEEEDPKSDPIITFTNKEREELSIDVQCDDWPVSQSILDFTKPMGAAEENVVIENSQKWEINTEFQIEDNKEVETRHADEESQKDLFEQEAKLNIKFEFVRPLTPPPISNNFVKAPGMASVKSDVSSSKSMCVASTSKKRDKPSYRYAEAPVRKKAERTKLVGDTCTDCEKYYSVYSEEVKKKMLQKCSRHRSKYGKEKTNSIQEEKFWAIDFDDEVDFCVTQPSTPKDQSER